MAIDTDIREQAYQFFLQEAPELLQEIEVGLNTLRQDKSTAQVHQIVRAAHSLKGGAASVELEEIKLLAKELERFFRSLHHEAVELDDELEDLLVKAYHRVRLPLMEQITTGQFNPQQAMSQAEPIFAQLEKRLGQFMDDSAPLPSSVDLGIDIAASIFEVDIAAGLDCVSSVLAQPQVDPATVAEALRAQAEVFVGIAEVLSLPGFGDIANTTLAALDTHPHQAIAIAQVALVDFQAAQTAVMAGDRTQGGTPSAALLQFAQSA